MRNVALTLALAFLLVSPAAAQVDEQLVTKALGKISAQGTLGKVKKLASDEFEGRNAGYAGCRKAADFIGEHFKKIGLNPIGEQGSYFQTFTFKARGDAPTGQDRGLSGKKDARKEKKKKKKKPDRAPQKPLYATPTTRNVVGLLEGSDQELKHEVVIVGAHYDHVGCEGQWNRGSRRGQAKGKDDIWNGADDNASGTAVVMEVAEAFATAGVRPKRSILFILFGAEEHGGVGAKWYCDHPLLPIEKTAAMINLDMVGYKKKRSIEIGGVDHAKNDVFRKAVKNATKRVHGLKTSLRSWASGGSSDHAPFVKLSIPTIYLFNGTHKDYHTIDDEIDCVSGKRMAKVAEVVFLTVLELAQLDAKPEFVKGPATADAPATPGVTAGGNLTEEEAKKLKLKRRQGGIKVTNVFANSPASNAGVEPGDVIIALGKEEVKLGRETLTLRNALRKLKPGQKFIIRIVRGKKKRSLKAEMTE